MACLVLWEMSPGTIYCLRLCLINSARCHPEVLWSANCSRRSVLSSPMHIHKNDRAKAEKSPIGAASSSQIQFFFFFLKHLRSDLYIHAKKKALLKTKIIHKCASSYVRIKFIITPIMFLFL